MKKISTLLVILFFIAFTKNIQAQSECLTPTDLHTVTVGSRSAQLNWTGSTDSLFVIAYKVVDPNIVYNWHYRKTTSNTFNLRLLLPNTTYICQVRAFCKFKTKSLFSETITFTTGDCKGVTELNVDKVANHSVKLSWGGTSNAYLIKFKEVNGKYFRYRKTIDNNIIIANLKSNTTYEWCVKSFCYGTDTSSVWTCGGLFVTTGCAAPKIVVEKKCDLS